VKRSLSNNLVYQLDNYLEYQILEAQIKFLNMVERVPYQGNQQKHRVVAHRH